ncbi:MAG: transcription elongation factor GreB [bacterium]
MAEYISTAGRARLADELHRLLTVERPTVVNTVAAAAAEGDRSENAEYIYGKKRLRQIDRRIEFLSKRLDQLQAVDRASTDQRVVFLSWVEVEDDAGAVRWYRIVGADETDAKQGWISFKSPVGRALLGKRRDETVHVPTPGGDREYTLLDIRIGPPA